MVAPRRGAQRSRDRFPRAARREAAPYKSDEEHITDLQNRMRGMTGAQAPSGASPELPGVNKPAAMPLGQAQAQIEALHGHPTFKAMGIGPETTANDLAALVNKRSDKIDPGILKLLRKYAKARAQLDDEFNPQNVSSAAAGVMSALLGDEPDIAAAIALEKKRVENLLSKGPTPGGFGFGDGF